LKPYFLPLPPQDFVAKKNGGDMVLPEGAARFAVTIDGTESNEELAALKGSAAVFAMLEVRHLPFPTEYHYVNAVLQV
jgi:hypothetical protein